MELILLQRVESLGKMGEVVNVKRGYGVNYLIPQKKALRATKANIELFEAQKKSLVELDLKHKDEAQILADRVTDVEVVLIRQAGESGHLFGSVTAKDISDQLGEEKILKSHVRIHHPIKMLGVYPVTLQVHPEIATTILVNVAKSTDEAKAQSEAAKALVETSAAEKVE